LVSDELEWATSVDKQLKRSETAGIVGGMSIACLFDLVIFDCDGVLVDSEMLSARVLMAQLAELDIALSPEQFRTEFLGHSFASAAVKLKMRTGRDLPSNFAPEYFIRLNSLFATDLKPMQGVKKVLQSLTVQNCVASGSIPPRLDFSLKVCGLDTHFGPHVYSAALVKNAKPAPDLFLHAAAAHGVSPNRCLVLEDSEMGVRAAQAANMTVWHFAGGSHVKAGQILPLDLHVDRVVQDMAEVLRLFAEAGLCDNSGVAPQTI
jgi:HAD superfamily hydrolase (TIGR01509 family)